MLCGSCQQPNRPEAKFCDGCGSPLGATADVPGTAPSPVAQVAEGRYRVERLVGEGARKRVYAATDTRLGRDVALALVKTDGLDPAGRERIAREARAMARLGDHPNIVTVYDVGDEGDQPYIVSQLMPGGSVTDLLDASPDRRLPVDEALRITAQLATALVHAHSKGVVHRDLKPANVWRAEDGTVLLGDFGLAATDDQSRLTLEGLVVGTVAYLAPEQAVGRSPDARSDLYSLGAMLYELLTGRPPFLGDDAVSVISQHLNTPPVAPSWHNAAVSNDLDELVLRLLAKDPGQRPESAQAVIEELARVRVVAPDAAPTLAATAPHPLTYGRMVGREGELQQLTGAFDDAVSGKTRLVMVVGEPGIGKSRLVEELAVYASVRGATVCWGHCYEGELGMPYLPFVEALRTYVRGTSDDDLRAELSTGAPEVAALVTELRQRFDDLPSSPPLDGDAERMRLFEGVSSFVRNAADGTPLVLLLDDLHWADKPTLLMLQYLVRNLRRARVLIVGTYRDVELDRAHPLADAVATLRREQLYERVLLRGLNPLDVKALIDAVDNQDSPLAFAEAIHRETEGNPFFVAEILRNLVETGAISRVDGQWTGSAESIAENLPEGVREVIGRRLSRLSDDANRMLTVGAAMPGGFSLDVVADVLGVDDEAMLDLLDEVLRAQVLRERREAAGTYEFAHALIRQTLYGELSTPRRVRMHRQVAAALEKAGAADDQLGELAFHCFHGAPGGDVEKAVDYATRAGVRATAQAAHEEAVRFYGMALDALDLGSEPAGMRKAELLLALGEAHSSAGDNESAGRILQAAAELGRLLDDPALLGRAALAAARFRMMGGGADAELLEEAVQRVGDTNDALLAQLLVQQVRDMFFSEKERARHLAAEAQVVAQRSGDAAALAAAVSVQSWMTDSRLERDAHRARQLELLRLAERLGDLQLHNAADGNLIYLALVEADRPAFDSLVARFVQRAQQSRSPFFLALSAGHQATAAVLSGQYALAEQLGADLLRHARRLGDAALVNQYGVIVMPIWRERGRLEEFETATLRAVEENPTVPAWHAGLAQMLAEMNKLDEAAVHVDVLVENGLVLLAEDPIGPYALAALAEAVAKLGDAPRAQELLELLRPLAGEAVTIGTFAYHGAVDRYLGLLELMLGRLDEASADLRAALSIHERMGALPWMARSQYDLARALVARNSSGDREEAVSLLNEALQAAEAIGMPKLVEEALAVKLGLQGVASSAPGASIDAIAAQLSLERPDLAEHAAPDGRVVIVFADIAGYTPLTERLGDQRTQEVLRGYYTIVREEVRRAGGVEVKSQGDGFMLAFPDPADAVACCVALQRRVSSRELAGERVQVRIGVHMGEVIREAGDFFGRTVIVAARVADQATGGDLLVTPEVAAVVPDANVREPREVTLKGLSGSQVVHAVEWRA